MRKILLTCALPFILWSCNDSTKQVETPAVAPDSATQKAATPKLVKPDSATQVQNWQAYATPGDMQKMMASWDGNWTGEASMWMSPDAPPATSSIGATYRSILGGRYSEGVHTGNMMGMPFEGRSLTAYDNARKVFQTTWVDNMGTGIMYMEGTWDPSTQMLTFKGKMVMPEMGDGTQGEVKQTIRIEDVDHQIMEMYMIDEAGKEIKTMEIRSVRKK